VVNKIRNRRSRSTIAIAGVGTRALVAGLAFGSVSFVAEQSAIAQVQSTAQQACVNGIGSAEKVGKQQGKANLACLKAAGEGTILGSAQECLSADSSGKIAAQTSRILDKENRLCLSLPDFAYTSGTEASLAAQLGRRQSFADVFGADLDTSAIACAASPAACACQSAVAKRAEGLTATKRKLFLQCKKSALKSGAASAADIAKCVDDWGTADSLAADSRGKSAKRVAMLAGTIAGTCDARSATGAALAGGRCGSLAGSELATCIDQRVACRVCQTINGGDGLLLDGAPADCDFFDDGAYNRSCDTAFDCHDPAHTQAAITKQIVSIDAQDQVHLQVEIVTLTASPFKLTVTSLAHPSGLELESLSTTSCSFGTLPQEHYRCRHSAFLRATTACTGTGDYRMVLKFGCSADGSECSLCSESETIDFRLTTENFCDGTVVNP
jgi:hypothetical protein